VRQWVLREQALYCRSEDLCFPSGWLQANHSSIFSLPFVCSDLQATGFTALWATELHHEDTQLASPTQTQTYLWKAKHNMAGNARASQQVTDLEQTPWDAVKIPSICTTPSTKRHQSSLDALCWGFKHTSPCPKHCGCLWLHHQGYTDNILSSFGVHTWLLPHIPPLGNVCCNAHTLGRGQLLFAFVSWWQDSGPWFVTLVPKC